MQEFNRVEFNIHGLLKNGNYVVKSIIKDLVKFIIVVVIIEKHFTNQDSYTFIFNNLGSEVILGELDIAY